MKILQHVLVGIAALALVSCGETETESPGDSGVPAASDRRAGSETAADASGSQPAPVVREEVDFAFARTSVSTSDADPTLCLHFTRPLDPSRDYEPFVAIDADVALAAEGQRLCVKGLGYGEEAELTLRRGLPSADGEELEADETVQLTFASRPPVVRFAGSGIIVPREDARGIGIVTINVPAVDVRISRVDDRALAFKEITEGFSVQEGRYQWTPEEEEAGRVGSAVFEGTLETPGPENAVTTTLLPIGESIGELEPGAYYVQIEDATAEERQILSPARAARWIVVTDLAMTAYHGSSGLDVTVRSLADAKPVRGARVSLVAQSNEILARERSGNEGRVSFGAPLLRGSEGDRPQLLFVENGGDFAFLDLDRAPLDLSAEPVGGPAAREGLDAFVYLDRGIYRPGETVHVSALVRDAEGYAAKGQPGALVAYRPNGTEFLRRRFETFGEAGSLVEAIELPAAASRGVWRVAVELDGPGQVGSQAFDVEDFVPQRLALDLAADTDAPLRAGERLPIEARARFLYGAPGAGLRIDGTARLEEDPNPFPEAEGFRFGLHDEPFQQEIVRLPTVTTDGDGVAILPLAPEDRGAEEPAPLRLRVVVRAEEPGGRAVQEDLRVPYRPRDLYVGIRSAFEGAAERDEAPRFEIAALGPGGDAVSADLRYRFVRHDYDYDWYQDRNGRWQWSRSERTVEIAEGTVAVGPSGRAAIEGPSLSWGDYELTVLRGEKALASTSFWVGYGGRTSDGTPAPDRVEVIGPDAPVAPGEVASIAVRSPYPGMAEVAVANGGVLSLRHIEIGPEGTELSVPVTDDWGAGAYVLVSVYNPREPGIQPVPRRAIGAAYVPVNTDARTFDVSLDMPDVARPEEPVRIELRARDGASGETVYATIAAVDEGILRLTKFETPDPAAALFGKTRLGVDIYDDYGRILDPDTGELGQLRSGGDEIGGAGLTVVPTKTVALFEGPVELGGNGRARIELDLPAFNGELRVMAVVWSKSGVGAASEALTVREEVPSELILPRFLAPGDEALATVTLDNVEGAPGSYTAAVSASGEVIDVAADPFEQDLRAGQRADTEVGIAAEEIGIGELSLTVRGPRRFETTRVYPIEVRSAFLPVTKLEQVVLQPGESFTPGAGTFEGFTPGSGELLITASPTPVDPDILQASLASYPYACTEQIVSQATPLLLKADRTSEETGRLQRLIETVLERQSADGAFGLWRVGDRNASPWLGAYTTDFIAKAREQGLPVPKSAVDMAYRALQPVSQGELQRSYGYDAELRWINSDDLRQRIEDRSVAYALYVLAQGGVVDRSRLRYVHDQRLEEISSPLARAQVAAALAAIGDAGRAGNAFDLARQAIGYVAPYDWYQTRIRDAAGVVALVAEAGQSERAAQTFREMANDIPAPDRLTTQEKAFLVRASYGLSGGAASAPLVRLGTEGEDYVLTQSDDLTQPFSNRGETPVYVTAMATGVPAEAPGPAGENLSVRKDVFTIDGSPVELSSVARGDRMIVALTMTPGNVARAQYAVMDLLPAGFEIETVLDPGDAGDDGPYAFLGELTDPSIAEARDDRFVAALTIQGQEPRRFAYIVRAVTPGRFVMPGVVAEDMYDPSVFARSEAGRVRIAP